MPGELEGLARAQEEVVVVEKQQEHEEGDWERETRRDWVISLYASFSYVEREEV